MIAIVLAIGDELVLGQTPDTNSSYLSAQLAQVGIFTRYHQAVADDRDAIATAIGQAGGEADLVLISGGLGPTEDDLTRQGLADAMGQPLVLHQPSLEVIRGFFTRRGRDMPDANRAQALHPAGTEIIPNSAGTAPGIKAHFQRATIYIMPGVPREMVIMFARSVLPEIEHHAPNRGVILTAKANTFGLGESSVAERLGPLMERHRNPKVGTTVAGGVVSVRVRSEWPDRREATEKLNATLAEIDRSLKPYVYGHDDQTLQQAVVSLLCERQLTLTTAESCTGGLLGRMITDVPGCSGVYLGGWVTYTNAMKARQLGVPQPVLDEHGAVSEPVARAMAQGALERSGAAAALAITGIAGPDGGTADKPVGLVWAALARRGQTATASTTIDALRLDLTGDREMIRDRAAKCALQMLRFSLLGESVDAMLWGRKVESGEWKVESGKSKTRTSTT
ncbi:MAG: competence/damage-inducible protein A [Phycisphaeraceae bacterium]